MTLIEQRDAIQAAIDGTFLEVRRRHATGEWTLLKEPPAYFDFQLWEYRVPPPARWYALVPRTDRDRLSVGVMYSSEAVAREHAFPHERVILVEKVKSL